MRHRNFRLFWFGQMVSLAGTWMQSTGQQWLVLTLTNNDARALGYVSALQWTPVIIISLFAGVIADRIPKRKILIATQSALSLAAFVLSILTLTGRVQYWHVLVVAGFAGIVQAFDMPTRQAFVVEMASKEDLLNAIALNSSIFNLARIVGPALAGLVIKAFGTGWAFFLNGVSFFGVIYAFLVMRVADRTRTTSKSMFDEIGAGLSYVARTRVVLGVMILMGIISTFALNFNVLVPLLARVVLKGDSSQFGFLMSVMGAGAFLGSIYLATFGSGEGPRIKSLIGGAILLGAAEMALLFAYGWTFSAAALFVSGAAMVTFSASANTTVQLVTPDELRGRVMSVYSLVFAGVTPLGALYTGFLAQSLGSPAAFGISGAIAIVTISAMVFLKALPASAERSREEGQEG